MATKSPSEDFSNGTKNISRQSIFTELLADQSVITKLPDIKLLISQKLLNVIICFNNHHECYEMVPRKETISCIFLNLVDNIQEYNTRGI